MNKLEIPPENIANSFCSYIRGVPESVPVKSVIPPVDSYRKHVTQRFITRREADIPNLIGKEFIVSVKVDGAFSGYYYNDTTTFLENYEKPYIIDPMTYFLNNPARSICNRENNPRKSYKRLSQEYLRLPDDIFIGEISEIEEPLLNLRESLEEFCQNVINFQKNCFQDTDLDAFFEEYLIDEVNVGRTPEILIAPYFLIENEDSYNLNRQCIDIAFQIHNDEIPLYACITISKQYLRENPLLHRRLREDFINYENIIVWISGFDAVREPVDNLLKFKEIINALSNEGRNNLINLYGDYFSFLLSKFGLKRFCSGLSGGTKKRAKLYKGSGGGIATKVYVPELNVFLLEEDFRTEIQMDNRLVCNCQKCQEISEPLDRDHPRFVNVYSNELMNQNNYLIHFIHCRNRENINIEDVELKDIIDELREKCRIYNAEHLENWLNDI